MKLHIFQSDKGDCLLLESADGKLMLCDGGMRSSMRSHVREQLGKLRQQGKKLDYVYVSHIDQDHISGVLQLLEDELEWRVYDFRRSNGYANAKKPQTPRPPEIKGLLHNAFRDQVEDNEGDIADMLAASAPVLYATEVEPFVELGVEFDNIALSIGEAIKVSSLVSPELLNIPLNRLPNSSGQARLIYFRKKPQSFNLGSMKFTIVGPTKEELDGLRDGWNNWLKDSEEDVQKIRDQMQKNIEKFSAGTSAAPPFDLRDWNGTPGYKGVTTPNIASLMFLAEENGKTILLTGDSQQDIIIKGLELTNMLAPGHLHLNALKVQHHGSENNIDAKFCRLVSADHYVFCGNGESGNPEPDVLQIIYDSRLGSQAKRSLAPASVDKPFTFWFSTTSAESPKFAETEKKAKALARKSKGQMKLKFNRGSHITLTL